MSEDATNTVPNSQTASTNATFAAQVQAEYYQNRTGKRRFSTMFIDIDIDIQVL
jgi:hypothetical protein